MKWAQTILDSFICPIYSVNLSSDEEFTGAGVVLVGNDDINSCFHYGSARQMDTEYDGREEEDAIH